MATYITGVATEGGSGTIITSPALNVQAGDGLIFGVKQEGGNTTITFTASAAQTIAHGTEINHSNTDLQGRMGYILSANANAALTISANFGASRSFLHLHVMQFRPAASTVFVFDIEPTGVQSNGSTLATGNFTKTGAGAVGAFFCEYSTVTYTPGSGWTDALAAATAAFSEYQLPVAGGTLNADCSIVGGPMDYIAMAIALTEQAAGGGSGLAVPRHLMALQSVKRASNF
jgi:hypothetical protein